MFFELVRAGLWGNGNLNIRIDGTTGWQEVYRLATEQSVLGLVLAGLEHSDVKPPQVLLLQWIGEVQMIEQRNKAMNQFVAELVEKMRAADIDALLVKGQGVAQCYERPLWRACGDVDFLLEKENYKKAKAYLRPLSKENKNEERYSQHFGMNIEQWYVEIHGTLRTGLAARLDRRIDAVQSEVFRDGKVRIWKNEVAEVYLPAPDYDVFLVFTHFIKHLYKGGVSLRQVCDWCRLLWTYRSELDVALQERWLRQAGLMDEWQAFAALAVEYLGMPVEAMPLFNENDSHNVILKRKAEQLMGFILTGNGRHKVREAFALAKIFPRNTVMFLPSIFLNLNWLKVKERLMGE